MPCSSLAFWLAVAALLAICICRSAGRVTIGELPRFSVLSTLMSSGTSNSKIIKPQTILEDDTTSSGDMATMTTDDVSSDSEDDGNRSVLYLVIHDQLRLLWRALKGKELIKSHKQRFYGEWRRRHFKRNYGRVLKHNNVPMFVG